MEIKAMPAFKTGKKPSGFGNFKDLGYIGGRTENVERLMAAFSYMTLGLGGLVYTLLSGRYARTHFFRFHFLQAILLGIFGTLIGWTSEAFVGIIGGILQMIPGAGPQMILFIPITVRLVLNAGLLLCLYGIIMSFLGREAPMPVISKLVRQQLR